MKRKKDMTDGRKMSATIRPTRVRYIKLGEGGRWEKECLEKGIIRFGFGSSNAERFPLCRARRWDDLATAARTEAATRRATLDINSELQCYIFHLEH